MRYPRAVPADGRPTGADVSPAAPGVYPSPYAAELSAAVALAREAGELALRARQEPFDIEHKADRSLVTGIDRALNALLVERLRARFPGDAVLGEESADDPGRLTARRLWLVDPIDGTANYALGIGEFTVVIGLAEAGLPVLGVVHEPVGQETFCAAAGGPALVERPGRPPAPIRVSEQAELAGARLVRSRSRRPGASEQYLATLGVLPPVRVGSLGLRICRVAAGEYDFTYSNDFRGGEWDLCGPLAVLAAAGGRAGDLEGRPIRFNRRPGERPAGFVASNDRLHHAVLAALARGPRQT